MGLKQEKHPHQQSELVTMPGVNNLNLEIPKRQQFLNADFWHRAVPKIVAVLTIAFLLMIPILGSAFHQLHVLEGWRSTELASTLLNINKTMESMQKRAGPPGTRGDTFFLHFFGTAVPCSALVCLGLFQITIEWF